MTRQKAIKTLRRRDGNKCLCCGRSGNLSIDHIVPKGLWSLEFGKHAKYAKQNLQLLCVHCNNNKSLYIESFRKDNGAYKTIDTYLNTAGGVIYIIYVLMLLKELNAN